MYNINKITKTLEEYNIVYQKTDDSIIIHRPVSPPNTLPTQAQLQKNWAFHNIITELISEERNFIEHQYKERYGVDVFHFPGEQYPIVEIWKDENYKIVTYIKFLNKKSSH